MCPSGMKKPSAIGCYEKVNLLRKHAAAGFTYTSGQTAAVYQVNKYWQSDDSWRNSGKPSLAWGLQWKKIVDDASFVWSLPHLEEEENTTSKSSSTKGRKTKVISQEIVNTHNPKINIRTCKVRKSQVPGATGAASTLPVAARGWGCRELCRSPRKHQNELKKQSQPTLPCSRSLKAEALVATKV